MMLWLLAWRFAAAPAWAQTIATVAGGLGGPGAATNIALASPRAVAVDSAGNLYIADESKHVVRKVDASTGIISTVAGNGTRGFGGDGSAATAAQLDYPAGVRVDGAGHLYIADRSNNRIRKVDASTGVISTVAGDGTPGFGGDGSAATAARLYQPLGVAVDGAGHLYIADGGNHLIRKVDAVTGFISTVAGNGTPGFGGDGSAATAAQLYTPFSVVMDGVGHLYIGDQGNNRIRMVTLTTSPGAPTDAAATAGDGQATVTWTVPVSDGGSPITSYTVTAVQDNTKQCTPSPVATATTCTVPGLTNGTAYTFTVTATNGVGTGSASAASAPVTPAGVPGATTGVAATPGAPGSGEVTLVWTAPASNGSTITSYTVTPPGTGPACTASPCTISGLANAAQYSFTVKASNGVGVGTVSASSAAVWLQGVNAISFPTQAGRAYVAGGTFAINPVATGLSSAPVTYGSQTAGVCTVLGTTVTTVGAGTCTLTANQLGDNAWSAAPQATQTVAIDQGVNAITFPAQAGQTYAAGGTFAISPVATGLSSAPVTYGSQTTAVCTVSGTTVTMAGAGTCTLTANQAGDANWAAAPQATQTVQIGATEPGAPTNATATPSNGQATVGWAAPSVTGGGITQYTVTAPGTAGCTATPPATSCTVPGLTNGATYVFSVRAENGAGASAPAVANAVTPLADSKAFSAPSPTGTGTVLVAVSGGGATCAFESVRLVQASSASTVPPVNLHLPHGLLDFVLAGCNQTDATVTITYPSLLPQGVQYWKLAGGFWVPYGGAVAVAGATMATLTLRDGGQGDDDHAQNGRIVDLGQVGVMAAAGPGGGVAAIPTLSETALMGLAALAALIGVARVRGLQPR